MTVRNPAQGFRESRQHQQESGEAQTDRLDIDAGAADPPEPSGTIAGEQQDKRDHTNGVTDRLLSNEKDGRSLAELISIVEQLKVRGVALLSLEEKIDTSSAAGELIFHVFGAIAHFERRLIAERTKDGIAAARARGKRPGRQPVDSDKVQAALKLVEAGLSPTKAANQLGLGRSTVYREVAAAGLGRSI